LFWAQDAELFSPAVGSGCLPGIARGLIVEWALANSITLREGVYSLQEVVAADEVFITAATTGPRAVASLTIGAGDDAMGYAYDSPGEVSRLLQELWRRKTSAT
jgi:4-amino-4-deoxychorismate lyase